MVEITVKNKAGTRVKIQEGNGGVFATKTVLKHNEDYKLKLDSNATYREYVLIRLPDNTALEPVFSSDDVLEYKQILIKKRKDASGQDEYFWTGITASASATASTKAPGQPPGASPPVVAPVQTVGASPTGILSRIKKFVGLSA